MASYSANKRGQKEVGSHRCAHQAIVESFGRGFQRHHASCVRTLFCTVLSCRPQRFPRHGRPRERASEPPKVPKWRASQPFWWTCAQQASEENIQRPRTFQPPLTACISTPKQSATHNPAQHALPYASAPSSDYTSTTVCSLVV